MSDDCVVIKQSTAMKISLFIGKHGQYDVVSEVIEEGDHWFEIGRYMLDDLRKPRQVGLDGKRFEDTWFESVEQVIVASREFLVSFLLRRLRIEYTYSNKHIKKRLQVVKGVVYYGLSRPRHNELGGHPRPSSLSPMSVRYT